MLYYIKKKEKIVQGYDFKIKSLAEVAADKRRGGEVRTLLSPKTVGSTSGFMGVATLKPGEKINEHYHPYSEEFIYIVSGTITAQLDGTSCELKTEQGLLIPIGTRHRLLNNAAQDAQLVFHLGPLAPRPDMGHVDTEE
jgi:putative monooxygenase